MAQLEALKIICKDEKLSCTGTTEQLKNRIVKHYIKSQEFSPKKYYAGLSTEEAKLRKKEITKGKKTSHKDKSAYKGFKTDIGKKTKPSTYTKMFHEKFPDIHSLSQISKATGIPSDIIKKVYNKGLAAWRTGHRPGATQGQWGYARVYSFVLKGCTYYSPDNTLVKEAKERSEKAKEHWKKMRCVCPKGCEHK